MGDSNNVFLGFLCAKEVVTQIDPSLTLTLIQQWRIKESKIDSFRQSVTIYLGGTNYRICPVAAVLTQLPGKEKVTLGPLFTVANGRYLTHDRFVKAVREAITASGIDTSKYVGHSFRIGAVAIAASSGVQDSLIGTMVWWESSAYTRYIRIMRDKTCTVAARPVGPRTSVVARNHLMQIEVDMMKVS